MVGQICRRILACLLALALLTGGAAFRRNGARAEEAEPAPTIRVLLRRLNLNTRADLSLTADYDAATSEGTLLRFPRGTELTVEIRDGAMFAFYGGYAVSAGTSLTLTRTSDPDGAGGFRVRPNEELYAGDLRLTVAEGALQPVATVSVEEYLLGVLPYEMSESFPLEALKAQAVCARTYALARRDPSREWDVTDDTMDQVYRGDRRDAPRCAQAIRETAGLVGTVGGELVICYYSASNGGQTELPKHIWKDREAADCYAVTDDPYDVENPASSVRKARLRRDGADLPAGFLNLLRETAAGLPEMKKRELAWESFRVDGIDAVRLTTPRFEEPNRLMTRMEITLRATVPGAAGSPEGTGTGAAETEPPEKTGTSAPEPDWSGEITLELPVFPDVEKTLGLSISGSQNELMTVEETNDAFVVYSRRFGHGAGMSQRGAQWMAGMYGKNFREILEFYFPGMELKQAPAGAQKLPEADPRLAATPGPAATPTPRPTLMPVSTDNLPEGAWVASVENIDDDSSLNLRAEPSASGEILRRLYKHQRLIVLETCEDPAWVHVRTDDLEGYVMVSFLEKAR